MSWVIGLLAILAVLAAIFWLWSDIEEERRLVKKWSDRLDNELMEMSLHVAAQCPDNKEAHRLVIEAAKKGFCRETCMNPYFRFEAAFMSLMKARELTGLCDSEWVQKIGDQLAADFS